MRLAPQIGRPRPTIRLRLTLLYGALILISGAALLGVTYVLVVNAGGSPTVYRDPSGSLVLTFGPQAQPVPDNGVGAPSADDPPKVEGEVVGSLPPGSTIGPGELQALAAAQQRAQLDLLARWSAVALAVMAVGSIVLGWMVAGRVLRPIRTMTSDARRITATNLGDRLVVQGPNDELRDLGLTLNDLLGRLDAAFQAQRQFVANASHELRTPLARQRTLVQLALADPDATVDSWRGVFGPVLVAGEQQERLIEALLVLARSERGIQRRDPIDLSRIAARVIDGRLQDAQERNVRVDAHLDAAATTGDERLIERLVGNLVDNAIRYNEPGGAVEVATSASGDEVVLHVGNGGALVPAAEVDAIFEPFHRVGADRISHGEGVGLGLSIVRAVARAHGGRASAVPRDAGGLDVAVRLPVSTLELQARDV